MQYLALLLLPDNRHGFSSYHTLEGSRQSIRDCLIVKLCQKFGSNVCVFKLFFKSWNNKIS